MIWPSLQSTFLLFVLTGSMSASGQTIPVHRGIKHPIGRMTTTSTCEGNHSFPTLPARNLGDVLVTDLPGVPTGLHGTGGNSTATLSFTASQGASSYQIYRSPDGVSQALIAANWPLTTFEDTHLNPSTSYFYSVAALGQGGAETAPSAQIQLTTTPPGPQPDAIRTLQLVLQDADTVRAFAPTMTTGTAAGSTECISYRWYLWDSDTGAMTLYNRTSADETFFPSDKIPRPDTPPVDTPNVLFALTVIAVQQDADGLP